MPSDSLFILLELQVQTGKSRVIQAITKYSERTLQRNSLLILAPSGIAVANIGGSTIHSACGLGVNDQLFDGHENLSKEAKAMLQKRWEKIEYFIIDEISMIGKSCYR